MISRFFSVLNQKVAIQQSWFDPWIESKTRSIEEYIIKKPILKKYAILVE